MQDCRRSSDAHPHWDVGTHPDASGHPSCWSAACTTSHPRSARQPSVESHGTSSGQSDYAWCIRQEPVPAPGTPPSRSPLLWQVSAVQSQPGVRRLLIRPPSDLKGPSTAQQDIQGAQGCSTTARGRTGAETELTARETRREGEAGELTSRGRQGIW